MFRINTIRGIVFTALGCMSFFIHSSDTSNRIYTLRFTGKQVSARLSSPAMQIAIESLRYNNNRYSNLVTYLHFFLYQKKSNSPIQFNSVYDNMARMLNFHPDDNSEVCDIIESMVGGDLNKYPAKEIYYPFES